MTAVQLELALPGNTVLVRCILVGKKLRVRPISNGYDSALNCAFPRSLRVPNAIYSVSSITYVGKYYRARRPICRLV